MAVQTQPETIVAETARTGTGLATSHVEYARTNYLYGLAYPHSDELNNPNQVAALLGPSASATAMVEPFAALGVNTTDYQYVNTSDNLLFRNPAVFAANSSLRPNTNTYSPGGVKSSELAARFDAALAAVQQMLLGAP